MLFFPSVLTILRQIVYAQWLLRGLGDRTREMWGSRQGVNVGPFWLLTSCNFSC